MKNMEKNKIRPVSCAQIRIATIFQMFIFNMRLHNYNYIYICLHFRRGLPKKKRKKENCFVSLFLVHQKLSCVVFDLCP